MDSVLDDMIRAFAPRSQALASSYWNELSRRNVDQLRTDGYENFKQTIARNYFTCLGRLADPQTRILARALPLSSVLKAFAVALISRRHRFFTASESIVYNFVTLLLWEYIRRQGAGDIVSQLSEPLEGNPPSVVIQGRHISQDLLHSALEYRSIAEGIGDLGGIRTIIELGAGYGRTAYVFLHMMPHIRYIIVDIPPALYISQRYLCNQFPGRRAFRFREFRNYSEIADVLGDAQLVFLLPTQLELLPSGIADLALAIDCLHEMRREQIAYFFSAIEHLTTGFLYFRCWKETKIPYDNVVLRETDYPVRESWHTIFWRDCDLLTFPTCWDRRIVEGKYFEALMSLQTPTESA